MLPVRHRQATATNSQPSARNAESCTHMAPRVTYWMSKPFTVYVNIRTPKEQLRKFGRATSFDS
ncbi:hypothetical protein PGTUg99_037298 [Puccinia graminis f. sp. tritici]|uniref:Uncharacterized protein n=1 Tax=Puccinia graminis f. sp. tritici TaxID=56615 RepID=A0A5B0SMV3_PUCGR|nr:hypothetical protein PGTUg99_037298 [Puccinia graminis f. sp. tritici]